MLQPWKLHKEDLDFPLKIWLDTLVWVVDIIG